MNVRFATGAHDELIEAANWYDRNQAGLGDRFAREFWNTVGRIVETPRAYPTLGGTARKCNLHRFAYGNVYRIKENTILILAVMHLKRKPGYWKHRK